MKKLFVLLCLLFVSCTTYSDCREYIKTYKEVCDFTKTTILVPEGFDGKYSIDFPAGYTPTDDIEVTFVQGDVDKITQLPFDCKTVEIWKCSE